ncbi:uncharacterized protein DFL_003697 [Arthrobotrys flagrans]|uniref:Mitochondrial genome maintenance protein MGM101 n=1 Tax=Arthrobotrys flagrans TaxID=97331 RepID=A0A437A2K9_ARTFL|nr:hypothetical protein DFL_003697 [Arthrobotrys flagrans]
MATLRIASTSLRRFAVSGLLKPLTSTSLPRFTAPIIASRCITTTPTKRQTPTPSLVPADQKVPATIRLTEIKDGPIASQEIDPGEELATDWSRSFSGLSQEPFAKEVADVLLQPLDPSEVEIKPDGIIYLPEIKYRRILNRAFGPGGWGLAPRGETQISEKPNGGGMVTREYALVCHGRLVSVARGEQDYFDEFGIPTAMEACKSNAMMRCCKDLGVASELWDPRFIKKWKKENANELFGEHVVTKKKKKLWVRKGESLEYPYQVSKFGS